MAVDLAELGFIAKIWWKHMFYIDVHMNVGYSTVLWGLGREWAQLVLFERSPWFENEVEEIYKIKYRLSMPDKRLIGIYSTTFTCTSFESLVLGEKFSHSVFLRFIFLFSIYDSILMYSVLLPINSILPQKKDWVPTTTKYSKISMDEKNKIYSHCTVPCFSIINQKFKGNLKFSPFLMFMFRRRSGTS